MNERRLLGALIGASVLLFWLQALRTGFSTLFGIIYDQIFLGPATVWLGVSNLLLLLAFLGPLALGGRAAAGSRWLGPLAAAIGRVWLSQPDPAVRFWASLVVLAAGSFYLSGVLRRDRALAIQGLGVALCLDQVLRGLGDTYDLSFQPGWMSLSLAWSGLLLAAVAGQSFPGVRGWGPTQVPEPGAKWPKDVGQEVAAGAQPDGLRPLQPPGWLAGLALGGWLFLETSLLSVPNAAAGWAGGGYAALSPGLLLATVLPLGWALGRAPAELRRLGRWSAFYVPVGLLLGYFAGGGWASTALLLAQLAAMLALAGLLRSSELPKPGWLAAGGLLALLAHYLIAFTFTYPYTLPAMRGLGWAVYLLAAAPLGLSALAPPSEEGTGTGDTLPAPAITAWRSPAWAAAGAAVLLAAWAVRPLAADSLPAGSLTLATYNIHYGYDSHWQFTLAEQAQLLAEEGVEVVALQEVDAARITSYLVDDAYFLARRLRMNAAYLPTVEHLTGIAVLYAGEPGSVREQLLTSLQEQTGIVAVELPGRLTAFGVWMGLENEDTLTQIEQALAFIGSAAPAAFGGDFNAEDGSPVIQAVRAAGFVDPFELLGMAPPPTDPAVDPSQRIDYLWLRGMAPLEARVAESLASDHRLVVVEGRALP